MATEVSEPEAIFLSTDDLWMLRRMMRMGGNYSDNGSRLYLFLKGLAEARQGATLTSGKPETAAIVAQPQARRSAEGGRK